MPAKKIIFCPFCGFRFHGPLTTRPAGGVNFVSFWRCGNPSCSYFGASSDYQRPGEQYMWGRPIRITAIGRTGPFNIEEVEKVIKTALRVFQPPAVAGSKLLDRVTVLGDLNDV